MDYQVIIKNSKKLQNFLSPFDFLKQITIYSQI